MSVPLPGCRKCGLILGPPDWGRVVLALFSAAVFFPGLFLFGHFSRGWQWPWYFRVPLGLAACVVLSALTYVFCVAGYGVLNCLRCRGKCPGCGTRLSLVTEWTFFELIHHNPRTGRFPQTISELLEKVPVGCEEYCFPERFYQILENIELEYCEEEGLAAMVVMDLLDVQYKDGTLLSKIGGTWGIEDMACVVAVRFKDISSDPIYWKIGFPIALSDEQVNKRAGRLKERIRTLPFVEALY